MKTNYLGDILLTTGIIGLVLNTMYYAIKTSNVFLGCTLLIIVGGLLMFRDSRNY